MNGLTPHTNPELFSAIILGTDRSPGTCTISGHDRIEDWDVQAAKGAEGATSTHNGKPVGKFQVTFYLAGDSDDANGENDFTKWGRFQKLIEGLTSGPNPVTVPIYHPDLCTQGFTEVSNGGIGGIVRDNLGGATVTVTFLEYRPIKKKAVAKATPKASAKTTPKPGVPAKPDPNAQRKKALDDLLKEAKKP